MKIPSISRIPKHHKFNYAPRFYDPIKEDIEQRTARIRRNLGKSPSDTYQSNIQHAFRRRATENKQSNITQLLMIILLLGTFFGYIYYGNIVLYIFVFIIPVYIFVRSKNFFRKQ